MPQALYQIRGRSINQNDLADIRAIIAGHWQEGRSAISRILCRKWQWQQPNGQMKDMACRALLLALEKRGEISLPPRQSESLRAPRRADRRARETNLHMVVNNVRFLILPWAKVRHLAFKLLAANLRLLARDWQDFYVHPVVLAETFVDTTRFQGTCYKAANWVHVGTTRGRGEYDRKSELAGHHRLVGLHQGGGGDVEFGLILTGKGGGPVLTHGAGAHGNA